MSVKQVKQGLTFNGLPINGSYVALPIPSNVPASSAGTTMETWCVPSVLPSTHLMTISPTDTQYISILSGIPFTSMKINGVQQTLTSGVGVGVNQLLHIVATYDGVNIRIYVNGSLRNTSPNYGGNVPLIDSAGFGSLGKYASGGFYFKGNLGAQRVYNRALSDVEVLANYSGDVARNGLVGEWLLNDGQGTTATDTSGNNNHGTINGATWVIERNAKKPKKNLFDKTKASADGNRIDGTNGNQFSSANNSYSDYIPVNPSKSYIGQNINLSGFNSGHWYAFYDVNKVYVSGGLDITFNAPANAYYLRVSFNTAVKDLVQIEEGSVATAFEPFTLVDGSKPSAKKPKKNMLQVTNAVVNGTPDTKSFDFTTQLVNGGTYTASGYWAIFPDDLTTNDRITIQFYYTDGTSSSATTPFNSLPRDGVERFQTVTATANPSKILSSIRLWTFDYSTGNNMMHRSVRDEMLCLGTFTDFEQYIPVNDMKLLPLVPKKNLINITTGIPNNYIDDTSGSLITSGLGIWAMDFIPVDATKSYTISGVATGIVTTMRFAWYDSNKNYLAGFIWIGGTPLPQTFAPPTNAKYVRFGVHPTDFTTAQLELGTVATPYEVYQLVGSVKRVT